MKESKNFQKKSKNYVMEKHSDEVLDKHEQIKEREEGDEQEHTLQENARKRAEHPDELNAGSPYDWEDLDDYQQELERLKREGPGHSHPDNCE